MSRQPTTAGLDRDSAIDVEWERFAQNGCPDWWLMAKYTSGWLSKGIPYVALKDRLSGSSWRSQSSPEAAVQQATVASGAVQPSAAARPPVRSHSLDTPVAAVLPLPEQAAAAGDVPPTADAAPAAAQETAAASAVRVGQVQRPSASGSPLAAGQPGHTPGCAPLKGLFGCQCTAPGQVDNSLDQAIT